MRPHHGVMEPVLPATAALLQATIRRSAPAIPQTDNLGQSGDERDLYYLLDYLSFAVERAYPEIPCGQGCSYCCNNQVFRVTDLEWQTLKSGLLALDESQRAGVFARARAEFGAHREALEQMATLWSAHERVEPDLHRSTPKGCPMLVEGRCSVYEDRPAICRGYGYFSATIEGTASLLICQQLGPDWIRQLENAGIEQVPMPNWNPVQRQLEQLNGQGAIKPLPLWLLEMAEAIDGALRVSPPGPDT
jgi:Fe-S-cluster containining protein